MKKDEQETKHNIIQQILSSPSQPQSNRQSKKITQGLKTLYKAKLKSIESKYELYNIGLLPTNGEILDAEFDAKPMVLLLGQYSTGKTTFLRHLVGGDFPGMHIGPEPTTDRFVALVHGKDDDDEYNDQNDDNDDKAQQGNHGKTIKGNSLTVIPELPFASLSQFGSSFLNHFEGSINSTSALLQHVTFIDTPGVLSGETTQRLSRDYDFASTAKWFADRSDLILLLFDAHKVDVSDEMKRVIECIRPHNDDKIRCILNKADGVSPEELVRVYGSLMWSMGRTFGTPEVIRVYTGSYWDKPYQNVDLEEMFTKDESKLAQELISLPKSSAERKVNRMVKRIRLVKAQICLLGHIQQKMSSFWWFWFLWNKIPFVNQEQQQKERYEKILLDMDTIIEDVCNKYHLSKGDLPNSKDISLRLFASSSLFSQGFLPAPSRKVLKILDDLVVKDIPELMKGAIDTGGGFTGGADSNGDDEFFQKRSVNGKLNTFSKTNKNQDRALSLVDNSKGNSKDDQHRKLMNATFYLLVFAILFIAAAISEWVFFSENKWISNMNFGGYTWLCSLLSSLVWGGA
mmetsp:Transcript_16194/g.23999  ORF Transcript_16194/g.23999 Transcript_16194/m.23999 type:complete len:572 (-) Transcript_16194:214-1929(-)